jgi:archaellum component FlaF (FlaF/FlaG flagellin family)
LRRKALDKAITTAFMVIASVVCAVLVFNAVYPAVIKSSDAMISMKNRVDERLKSQVEIIHAAQDGSNAVVWVKNVGSLRIASVESCDVFFGPQGDFSRIPYCCPPSPTPTPSAPYWAGEVKNDSDWNPTATLQITILDYSLSQGERYFVKVVLPNGISDEDYFSIPTP